MRLLILGGTQFLGRHLVDAAHARGHEVTLFNRGRTNPDLFPGSEAHFAQVLDRWTLYHLTCVYVGHDREHAGDLRKALAVELEESAMR